MNQLTPVYVRSKPVPRRACVNLLNLFNKCEKGSSQSDKKFKASEISQIQRERLQAQYHLQPHPYFNVEEAAARSASFICEIGDNRPSLRQQLENYAAKVNSSTKIVKDMTNLMRQFSSALPPYDYSQYEVLQSEPFQTYHMSAGTYFHFGLERHLTVPDNCSDKTLYLDIAIHVIKVNVDGVTRPKYMVIYGRSSKLNKTFVIGLYYGNFPIELIANEILQPFVAEMMILQVNGIAFEDRSCAISVRSIVCDPIANSLITCTSLPNSMFGCSKCKGRGTLHLNNYITSFPVVFNAADSRDNDDFKFCVVTEHHLATPIIMELGVQLISEVSIDYKHTVCLGVIKTLIELWMTGDLSYRLNKSTVAKITSELEDLNGFCPEEFKNKPRPLEEFKTWTAYDYRQFLLYYGPIVLKENLNRNHYVNLLYINLAMRIYLDPDNLNDMNYFIAGYLLQTFVKDFAYLYGSGLVDYNVHNLLHLEDIARKFGSLEAVGNFSFNPAMDDIEELITKKTKNPSWPLQDMAKIISLKNLQEKEITEPKPPNTIRFNNITLSNEEPDNYVVTEKGIVRIKSIGHNQNGEIVIYGRIYLHTSPFTEVLTTLQNITEVHDLSTVKKFEGSEILTKAVVFNTEKGIFAMPLLSF